MSTFPPKDPPFDVWLETFLSAACPNAEDRRILLAGIRSQTKLAAQQIGELAARATDDVEHWKQRATESADYSTRMFEEASQWKARAEWAEQSAHTRAKQLEEVSARLVAMERDRDEYHARYLATVASWEGAKAAREKSDSLL